MSKMSRKVELQTEENAVSSPLRRSSRISLSAETTVKPVKTRRSSSDSTVIQEKKEAKPIKTRRASGTKDEPEKRSAIVTRRRSSATEESQPDTPRSLRSRRISNSEKESIVKEEIKNVTHSRRSLSVDLDIIDTNQKSVLKTRSQSLDVENNPLEIKRVTRSRRSSADKIEESESATSTITLASKLYDTLDPVLEKLPDVKLTPIKRKPETGDLNLSVIEELSFTDEKVTEETETSLKTTSNEPTLDSNEKSIEKLTLSKRKSPRLSKESEPTKKLEFHEELKLIRKNLVMDIDANLNTDEKATAPNAKLGKGIQLFEDNSDNAKKIRGRNSNSNTSAERRSASINSNDLNKIVTDAEGTNKSPSKSQINEDILSGTIISSPSHRKTSTGWKESIGSSEISGAEKVYLPRNQVDSNNSPKLKESNSPDIQSIQEYRKSILNTSTGSNNSDKENICNSNNLSTELLKPEVELHVISQVQRVSNVFCPKQIDYSFVEPMEVDEQSVLNNTRNKAGVDLNETNIISQISHKTSMDDSIDPSFNLCLNVTNGEKDSMSQLVIELDEDGENTNPAKEKNDTEMCQFSNHNEKPVKEQIQEATEGKLLVGGILENKVEVNASLDYEFHLETDEDEFDSDGTKCSKYIENKFRDISSQLSENKTEEIIEVEIKDESDENNTEAGDIEIRNDEDKLDASLVKVASESIKQIENIKEEVIESDTENPLDITTNKPVLLIDKLTDKSINEKYTEVLSSEANDSCNDNSQSHKSVEQLNLSDSNDYIMKLKDDNNGTAIMDKSDFNAVRNSEEQIEISDIEQCASTNTNEEITVIEITNSTEIVNKCNSSKLKIIENVANNESMGDIHASLIFNENSTLVTAIDANDEPKTTSNFKAQFENKVINILSDNQTIQKKKLSVGENIQNCDKSMPEDEFVDVETNGMETALVSFPDSSNIHTSEKSNLKSVESTTSDRTEDNSKKGGEFEVTITNNLSVSGETISKSCSSKFEMDRSISEDTIKDNTSSKLEMDRSISEETIKDHIELYKHNTKLDSNFDSSVTVDKLLITNSQDKDKIIESDPIKNGDEKNTMSEHELNENTESNKMEVTNQNKNQIKKIEPILEDNSDKIRNTSTSKLDEFLEKRLPKMCEESDNYEDNSEEGSNNDFEESNGNEFIDDMAVEGEEDTPSEDSNQIIDEGESINSTESEIDSDEDYDDNDSFICDDEENELLSGEEYDLGQETQKKNKPSRIIHLENYNSDVILVKPKINSTNEKKRKSRIIDIKDSDEDVINIDKLKMKNTKLKKSPTMNAADSDENIKVNKPINKTNKQFQKNESSNKEILLTKEENEEPPYTRKSSITVHENISLTGSADDSLSQRINSLVDSFCSKIQKGDISLNLSLEYDGETKTTDVISKGNHSKSKAEDVTKQPRNKKRVNSDLDNSSDQTPNIATEVVSCKRKKRRNHQDIQLKKNKTKDLCLQSLSLMNQLITDVKNRPVRSVKPSTSKEDLNNSWIVDIVEIRPSTSVVTKKDIELYKKKKVHSKDFRQQMLYDSSRIQRTDTKKLLKKRGAYK